jgi:hypothetical protein
MNGHNKRFMANTPGYLNSHSIIVPISFVTLGDPRCLQNGHVYVFDLQDLQQPNHINAQNGTSVVLLTEQQHRNKGVGSFTKAINAMWLDGPDGGTSSSNLPGQGINYIFTESLGGCSVYIDNGRIHHNPSGKVPNGAVAVSEPYQGSNGVFAQTCAVAYFTNGQWNIGTSVPHDAGGFRRQHASGYEYLGN